MVIYAVLEKKYIIVNKHKNIKMDSLCNFREKIFCKKKSMYFFSLKRWSFLKDMLILQETLETGKFMQF